MNLKVLILSFFGIGNCRMEKDCVEEIINDVVWPNTPNGTCTSSIPGCASDGVLQFRCCIFGEFTENDCISNSSMEDPRCFGDMKSTVENKSLKFCYKIVDSKTYPYDCISRTNLMIQPDLDLLTNIGKSSEIILPVQRYQNIFRYVQRNDFYMDTFQSVHSDFSHDCMILNGTSIRDVPCNNQYKGICLDFPYVIQTIGKQYFADLFSKVIVFCVLHSNEFCKNFQETHPLNIAYYSSRKYFENYLILQKSNLRVIVQVRVDIPPTDPMRVLFVALTDADRNLFINSSIQFEEPTNFDDYPQPTIQLSVINNTIQITETNEKNIKWMRKKDGSHSIFCFFNSTTDNKLEKFEIKAMESLNYKFDGRAGYVWCSAFDYDLNVISSPSVEIKTPNAYISEFLIMFKNRRCRQFFFKLTLEQILKKIFEETIKFERGLSFLIHSHKCVTKTGVSVVVRWNFKKPAKTIEKIDLEYEKLKKILGKIPIGLNDVTNVVVNFLRHTNYCMKDVTFYDNFTFIWPTTLINNFSNSIPRCYVDKWSFPETRTCLENYTAGAGWSTFESCRPFSNLTQVLQEMLNEYLYGDIILNNLISLVRNSAKKFQPIDMNLTATLLEKLKNHHINLSNLSNLINNIQGIERDVLEKSQDKFGATDLILHSIDGLYRGKEKKVIDINKYYLNIPINFDPLGKSVSIILQNKGDSHEVKIMENISQINDNFEAAIMFDYNFNPTFTQAAAIILSVFFDDYLFNGNVLQVNTSPIFKLLQTYNQDVTVFLMTKLGGIEKRCGCWNTKATLEQKKWQQAVKIQTESFPICVFKSSSYCTMYTEYSFDFTYTYVAKVFVEYTENVPKHSIFLMKVWGSLIKIFNSFFPSSPIGGMSYEAEILKQNVTLGSMEILLYLNLSEPAEKIPEIEEEYNKLKEITKRIEVESNEIIKSIKFVNLRHTKYCMNEIMKKSYVKFNWPTTLFGKSSNSTPFCMNSENREIKVRNCSKISTKGAVWENTTCSMVTLSDLLLNFDPSQINQVLNNLNDIIEISSKDFQPLDISLLADILELCSDSDSKLINITTVSSVISNVQKIDRNVLEESQKSNNATDKILDSIDKIISTTKFTTANMTEFFVIKLSNYSNNTAIVLQIFDDNYQVSVMNFTDEYELLQYENFEAAVIFKHKLLEDMQKINESISVSIFFKDVLFNSINPKYTVSIIFGIQTPNFKIDKNSEPIELIFKNNSGSRGCAFWKYGMENHTPIQGDWKNESESQELPDFFKCKFNHTTHFAMLINDVGEDSNILDLITNIGCFLSFIGLVGILITGLIFEKWRKNLGNIILMNFVFTVCIQISLFYFSRSVNEFMSSSDFCIFIGAFLHYSVVSEFFWMLIVAILQFKRFVQVLTGPPKYVIFKSFVIGWMLPLIPVSLILIINPDNYSAGVVGLCYPTHMGLYLGVWLPISIVLLINFIIFCYIMYNIFHRKTECVNTVSDEVILQWKLAVLLFFMLGLTWSFAFVGQFIYTELFSYLFCISATSQGFVMFLFFILFNGRTRLLYVNLFKKLLRVYN